MFLIKGTAAADSGINRTYYGDMFGAKILNACDSEICSCRE